MLSTNLGSSPLPPGDPHTWSTHDDVEVHTENTDSWVVLDTEINVLLDTETEVTSCGEVSICQRRRRRIVRDSSRLDERWVEWSWAGVDVM